METFTLTTPVVPPTLTGWRIARLCLNWYGQQIDIDLVGPNEERKSFGYTGSTAVSLMTILNTANLSTTSLHKRVLQKLATDGYLAGNVTGVPD